MSDRAVIRKSHGFLQISEDGNRPLPRPLLRKFESQMTYTAVIREHAGFRGGGMADYQTYTEPRLLFHYDANGLYVCQRGYLPVVRDILHAAGRQIEFADYDPPVSPEVFQVDWDNVLRHYDFRPTQDTCLLQMDASDGGIIDAVTAFGKSAVIVMVCLLYPRAKIDIIVKSKSIAETLYNRLIAVIPNIGFIGGGKKRRGRVTVIMADSLQHTDYTANIVLADEVHTLMTDNYARKLSRYWYAKMFGFTASKLTRADNLFGRMTGMFGPTIFSLDYKTAVALGLVVPIVVLWNDVNMDRNPVENITKMVERKRHAFWRNDYRNYIISKSVEPFVAANQQVLIAVETVEHALFLKKHLPHFELCYAEQSLDSSDRFKYTRLGVLQPNEPEMTPQRRQALRLAFERRELMHVIATSVWSTGVSFDGLEVQVRAEGLQSETAAIQVPGRVCRINPATDKEYGVVIDFMDNFDRNTKNSSLSRRRSYGSHDWTQYLPNGRMYTAKPAAPATPAARTGVSHDLL